MASGSYRREGKSPELSELPEEGELMPQQQQQPGLHQIVLPFVEPPIPRPSKYKEFGERQRAAELASLHDMESTSRALDEEEREIESAFLGSIRGEPSLAYAGGRQGSDARPPTSNFSSPSSVANVGTHFDNNPVFSQTLP
ncbi:hypothetical protein R1flu_007192 [Riccia fluitans]|uniref:Uncharacterized protein n=1 Tax=Riccia fluitans TaxID=41844 RepID=A0ABD1YYD7_9MARC